MRSPRRWHTRYGYHPSPQQRYFGAQKPKKRAKVLLFFELTKYFVIFYKKSSIIELLLITIPSSAIEHTDGGVCGITK